MRPLVIGYHLVWTIYGSWLPNDPRGSSSQAVCSDVLADLGTLHHGRKRLQPTGWEIRQFSESAATRLKYPVIRLDTAMLACVADAFEDEIKRAKYTCYSGAIMPDHIHLVIRKHRDSAELMIANLQRESRLRLIANGLIDFEHPVWGGHGWSVFLDEPADIWRTIEYVQKNPRTPQTWPFVTPYDNWPLHPGHNPNSPYARRLRGH